MDYSQYIEFINGIMERSSTVNNSYLIFLENDETLLLNF
jgi:hypothetical protein